MYHFISVKLHVQAVSLLSRTGGRLAVSCLVLGRPARKMLKNPIIIVIIICFCRLNHANDFISYEGDIYKLT